VADDYRGQHEAPDAESGAPMHDLAGDVYPADFYETQSYYRTGEDRADNESFAAVNTVRGKPNAKVRVYRAVPHLPSTEEQIEEYEQQKRVMLRRGQFPPGVDPSAGHSPAFGLDVNGYFEWVHAEIERLRAGEQREAVAYGINPGDWVTPSKAYARQHIESNIGARSRIVSKLVPACELFTEGDSINEWGWVPRAATRKTNPPTGA